MFFRINDDITCTVYEQAQTKQLVPAEPYEPRQKPYFVYTDADALIADQKRRFTREEGTNVVVTANGSEQRKDVRVDKDVYYRAHTQSNATCDA